MNAGLRRMFLPLAGAVVLIVAAVVPVHASTGAKDQCRPGDVCVWEHDDYKGCFARLPARDRDWSDGAPEWTTCPGKKPKTMNDQVSSYWNRHPDLWVAIFANAKFRGGGAVCGAPNAQSPDFHNFAFLWDDPEDHASSHVLVPKEEIDHPLNGGFCAGQDTD